MQNIGNVSLHDTNRYAFVPNNTKNLICYFKNQSRSDGSSSISFLPLGFPVNLVMWRDVSKSALVFGLGTFLLISSSYAKDLNFK